jgi:Ca-activated chloride channel family protein
MNCQEVQERLTDALLDEAPEDERSALLEHAESCAACAREADELRQAVALLRDAEWPNDAVLSDERRALLLAQAPKPKPRVHWSVVLGASLATAATLLVALTPGLYRRTPTPLPVPYQQRDELRYAPPAAPPPPQALRPTQEQSERLKALGYMYDESLSAPIDGGVEGGVPGGVVGGVVGGLPDVPDMYFEHKGTNPFVATEKDSLSTFGLDVDTASYTLARSYLRRGMLPPPESVRVEEFVNALPQDYPAPSDATFGIHLEAAPSPFRDGRTFLRVGVRAKDVARRDRKPAHLTFVVDVSGSMAAENRLGLVRRSLRLLVDRLDERDWIGLVVYGSEGRVVLRPTPVSERDTILDAVETLEPEGSTNLEEGLDLGYRLAGGSYDPSVTNRVVLCTDGVANNGLSDAGSLLRMVRMQARKGIDMTALGFGMGNYNDALLQKLADEGDGQYAYIDDYAAAKRFFLRDLTGVLETVARDARAQVEFDKARVARYRLIGYEKRDMADDDFRNDSVDAGEVNAGQAVTALYELTLLPGNGALGTVRLRYADPETGTPAEVERPIPAETLRASYEEASARFQLTVVAARFAEHLRHSRWVPPAETLGSVADLAGSLPPATMATAEAKDLVGLVRDAVRISNPRR